MRSNFVRFMLALFLWAAIAHVTLPVPAALAQEAATSLPSPLTPDAVDALVSRMSDREVRDLLLQELGARAEAASTGEPKPQVSLVERVTQNLSAGARQIVKAMAEAPKNTGALANGLKSYGASLGFGGAIKLVLAIAAAIGIGIAVDRIYSRWQAGRSNQSSSTDEEIPPFPASIPILARRLLRDAAGAIVALVVAIVVLGLLLPEREAKVGTTFVVWMIFFPRFVSIVLRFLLSPDRPSRRLVVTDDWTARVLHKNLVGLTAVAGLFQTMMQISRVIEAGVSEEHAGFWISVVLYLWLVAVFIICRKGLRMMVRGRTEHLTRGEEWVVFAYPGFAVIAILATWLLSNLAPALGKEEVVLKGHHLISLAILLVTPLCDTIIRATVRLLVPPLRGSGEIAIHAYQAAWNSYVRIARVLVFGAIVMILAWLWDLSLFFHKGDSGGLFSGAFIEGLLILVVGYVALEVVSLMINRKLAEEQGVAAIDEALEVDEGPTTGAASRLGTILPVVSWAAQAAILAVTILTALGHIGVNVTALLAGAGVIGIAIGFGAQKLVADVVSGIFFLIDDAFRLNEYINAGGMEGTVEKIALRSMLLRKSDGAIHCIPYSNISSVTNFGRDWGTMKQVFTVPFDTDIEKVRKIFKKIGQDLSDNPEFADAFIQPFKYKGVSQVNDVGIVVRGKFMFKPALAKQFLIQREIYKRVQADFATAGIKFARREVRVSVDTPEGTTPDKTARAVAAAAASAASVDDAIAAAKPKPAP